DARPLPPPSSCPCVELTALHAHTHTHASAHTHTHARPHTHSHVTYQNHMSILLPPTPQHIISHPPPIKTHTTDTNTHAHNLFQTHTSHTHTHTHTHMQTISFRHTPHTLSHLSSVFLIFFFSQIGSLHHGLGCVSITPPPLMNVFCLKEN